MTAPSFKRIPLLVRGELISAIAPLVVSASRATDIPALYGEWLVREFTHGYTCRKNPFNGKPTWLALTETQMIAFSSKNPKPFLRYLYLFEKREISFFLL